MAIVKTVPYDKDGKVVKTWYAEGDIRLQYRDAQVTTEWRDNVVKKLTLTFLYVSGGQYSDKFAFKDESGEVWEVQSADFNKMVPLMQFGVITANFKVTKVRHYYHLKLVD